MKCNKLSLLLLLLLFLPFHSGCLDGVSLDSYGYVLSIGVDEGETEKYNVSFLLQKEGDSQESQTGAGSYVISAEGGDLFEAVRIAHAGLPFELNFSRVNFLLFSDAVASSNRMDEFLRFSFDLMKIRQSAKLLIVRGKCSDYLQGLSSTDQPNVAKRQYSYFRTYQTEGIIMMTNHAEFREAVLSGTFDAVLPVGEVDASITAEAGANAPKTDLPINDKDTTGGVRRTGGLRSYLLESALFDGERLAGFLDADDTEMILMACGNFERGFFSLQDEFGTTGFVLIAAGEPQVSITLGDAPHASVRIPLYAQIEFDTGNTARQRWESELKAELEAHLSQELSRVFLQCRALDSDAMRFGTHAVKQFASRDAWRDYAWKEKYKSMTADFSATVMLSDRIISNRGD